MFIKVYNDMLLTLINNSYIILHGKIGRISFFDLVVENSKI